MSKMRKPQEAFATPTAQGENNKEVHLHAKTPHKAMTRSIYPAISKGEKKTWRTPIHALSNPIHTKKK